jgi:basic amino acid/polyamine antiporter, APA family
MSPAEPHPAPVSSDRAELRRDVSVWGSFMWGYADVGADIYAALGLVIAATMGLAPLAFFIAGCVYIMIGLAYTEMASAYPVAGGGQYYSLRGLGDFTGFVAGSALLLDYTIDIAMFSVFAAGYVNFFVPALGSVSVSWGPIKDFNPVWLGESLLIIAFLTLLNIKGMKESSLFNELLGAIDILAESSVIIFGFVLAWKPELFADQWLHARPTLPQFMYGSSLAIISFVGLESISQAAQETRRPATIVPRTSLTLIFTVFIFAMAFSTLATGLVHWKIFADAKSDPVAILAHHIPLIGIAAGPFVALLGATILTISANSGIMSASRLSYSMAEFKLLSPWFDRVHRRFRTPVRAILIFSGIGALQTTVAFLLGKDRALDILANMYAFGATLGYFLVFVAMIWLRFKDPYSPRPYKVPFNARWRRKSGEVIEIPILGFFGALSVLFVFFEVVWTHDIGRIAGPVWVLLCFSYYVWYRRKNGYPVFRSIPRRWEEEQKAILKSAEEYDMLEQYTIALAGRDRALARAAEKAGTPPPGVP